MGEAENKRLFEHYTNVANGNVKSGNPVRDDLNASDAKRHLADLVKKNPSLEIKEDYPEKNINLPPEERKPTQKTKSKEKK